MAEKERVNGLKEKTESGAVKMHLIRQLIGMIRFITERRRPELFDCEMAGKQGRSLLFLFPVVPYTSNTWVSLRSDIHLATVRANDWQRCTEMN
jgi:hypothetical protein